VRAMASKKTIPTASDSRNTIKEFIRASRPYKTHGKNYLTEALALPAPAKANDLDRLSKPELETVLNYYVRRNQADPLQQQQKRKTAGDVCFLSTPSVFLLLVAEPQEKQTR